MRRLTRILFSLPHNGGAHGAPAQGAERGVGHLRGALRWLTVALAEVRPPASDRAGGGVPDARTWRVGLPVWGGAHELSLELWTPNAEPGGRNLEPGTGIQNPETGEPCSDESHVARDGASGHDGDGSGPRLSRRHQRTRLSPASGARRRGFTQRPDIWGARSL